jgi:hypothetical protein
MTPRARPRTRRILENCIFYCEFVFESEVNVLFEDLRDEI